MRSIIPLLILAMTFTAMACAQREDPDEPWVGGGRGEPVHGDTVTIRGVQGATGDITLAFRLKPDDGLPRTVGLKYAGACAGDDLWRTAVTTSPRVDLAPGEHTIVWHSWDQEAGCAGAVRLRLDTTRGESAVSDEFALANDADGATGLIEYPIVDQGVQSDEEWVYELALDALLADPTVDFVATRIDDEYEVHSARGSVVFRRDHDRDGYHYEVEAVDGANPIENQDPTWLATYDEELAAGDNPNNVKIPAEGYDAGDPRLSFIEPENDAYPFGYERIAAYFDHPRAADLMINWKAYAHGDVDLGEHGSLNVTQSRSPLIMAGAGINPGPISHPVRIVDIAPTVAKLLGLSATAGVDARGVASHEVYLRQQDGAPIDDVLSGEGAEHVIVIVFDGFAHTEMMRQLQERRDSLPNLAWLAAHGAVARYGAITNYPSVTYPSHNSIGFGLYSGHHGLVDNQFYIREEADDPHPIDELFFSEQYIDPVGPGESIYEAIGRNLGWYDKWTDNGALNASLFDPCTLGAGKANLEFRDKSGQSFFPPLFYDYYPPGIPMPDPYFGTLDTWVGQVTEWSSLVELFALFNNGISPMPVYTQINWLTTDSAGHVNGPHGRMLDKVVDHIDADLGVLMDWLQYWGIADTTTIIITADHGMQLGDPSRSGWPPDSLAAAGIGYVPGMWLGVYFRIPKATFDPPAPVSGVFQLLTARVADQDNNIPIAGATVLATDGAVDLLAQTNENGLAEFGIAPVGPIAFTIEHPDYTRRELVLEVVEE